MSEGEVKDENLSDDYHYKLQFKKTVQDKILELWFKEHQWSCVLDAIVAMMHLDPLQRLKAGENIDMLKRCACDLGLTVEDEVVENAEST
jgi:hypothetical protein